MDHDVCVGFMTLAKRAGGGRCDASLSEIASSRKGIPK